MAAQDKWIISLDLDTSGLTRGLSDIRGQLDALGRPAGFTGGSSSTYLSGGEQVVGAIGPGYAGGAGVGGDTGGLRELMAAQVAMASNIQQQVSQIRNLSNLNRNAIGRGTGDIITLPGSAARERAVVDIAAARTQSGLARQYTNQLRSTVGYQAEVISSQQAIIAANRYAAASIRRRADVAYNQVLAIAQPAQTPLPVAPSSPTAVAPRALPLPVSQTGDRNIPLVVAAPPARAIQTARETARTSINQPYSDNTNRLLAAEGGLIAALSSKAQALQAQTSIVTSNLGRFASAENSLIAAMEAKAAALAQVPSTALPVGATASAITSGAIPPAVAAGVIPRGALGPATVTQTIAPRPQYERVRPQYIDSPTQGRVFQTAIDAEKMWDRFVESARSFQPKFAEQLGPAFTRDIAGARATAITRGDYSELLTRISRLIPPSNFSPIEPVAGDRLRYASAKALEYHPFLLDRFKEIGSFTQIGVNRPLTARGLTRQSNQPTYVGYNDNFGTGAYTDEIFAKKYKAGLEASPVITKTAFHEVAGHHLDYAALDRSKDRYAATLSRVLQRYVGPVDNPEDVIRDALGPYAATRNQAGRLSEVIPEAVAQVYTAPKPSGLALDLYQGVHQLVAPAPSLQEIERRRRSIAAGDQSFTRDIAGARYQNRSRDREYLGSGVDAEAFGFTGPFGQQLVERIFDDALPTRLIERRVEGLRRAADVPRAEQLVSAQGRDVITTRLPGKDLWNPLGVNPTLPQIAELVDTLKQLGSRGVSIDAGAGNFLYEPQRGFGVIDFQPTNINTGIATRQNVESGLNTVRNALPRNPQVPVGAIYELEAAALRDIAGARLSGESRRGPEFIGDHIDTVQGARARNAIRNYLEFDPQLSSTIGAVVDFPAAAKGLNLGPWDFNQQYGTSGGIAFPGKNKSLLALNPFIGYGNLSRFNGTKGSGWTVGVDPVLDIPLHEVGHALDFEARRKGGSSYVDSVKDILRSFSSEYNLSDRPPSDRRIAKVASVISPYAGTSLQEALAESTANLFGSSSQNAFFDSPEYGLSTELYRNARRFAFGYAPPERAIQNAADKIYDRDSELLGGDFVKGRDELVQQAVFAAPDSRYARVAFEQLQRKYGVKNSGDRVVGSSAGDFLLTEGTAWKSGVDYPEIRDIAGASRRGLGRQEYLDEFVSLTRRVQDNEKFGDLRDPASYPGLPGATSADAERLWRHANTSETFPGQPSWVDFSKARGYTEPQIADMRRLRTLFGDDEIIGGVASSGIPEIEGGWGVAPLADGSGRRKTDAERREYGNAVYDRLLTEGVEIPPRGISDIAGARGKAGAYQLLEDIGEAQKLLSFLPLPENPDQFRDARAMAAANPRIQEGIATARNYIDEFPFSSPVRRNLDRGIITELEAAALRDIAGARYNQRRDIREFDLDATGNFPVLQRMLPYQGGYLEAQVLALPHGSDIPYQLAGKRPELRPSILPVGSRVLDNQPLLTNSQLSTVGSYNDGNELPYIGRRDWDEVVRYIQNDKIPQSRRDFPKATDLVSRLREQTRLDFDSNGLDAARLYRGTNLESIGPSAGTGNKWIPDVSSSWTSGAFRDDLATTFAGWRASSSGDLGAPLDFPVLLTANIPKESIVSYDRYGNQASNSFEKVGGGLTEEQVAQLRANTGNVAAVNGLLGQFGTIASPTFAIPGREVLVDATGGAGFQLPADFRDELQGFVNAARVWRNQLENVGAAALLRPPVQGTGKLIVPPVPTTPAEIAAFWGESLPDIAGARRNVRQGLAGTSVRAEELLDASMRDFFNPDEIQEVLGAVENLAQRAPALFRRVIRSQEEFWNDTEAQARVLSQYTSGDPAALLGPRGGVISPLVQAGQRDLEGRLSTAENTLAGRLLAGDRVSDAQRAEIGGSLAGATFGVTGIPFATALNPEVARSGETPSQAGIVNNSLAGITSHELTHFAAGGNGLGGVPEVLAGVRKVMSDFGLFETPSGAIGGNAHLLPSPLAFQDIGELTSESVSAELTGVGSSPFTAAVFGAVNEGLLQSEDREKAAVDQLTVAAQQAAAALEYLATATAAQVRALGVPQSVAQTVIASRPTSLEELAALPGVGPARQAALLENGAKAQEALGSGAGATPPPTPPVAIGPAGDLPVPRGLRAEEIARRRAAIRSEIVDPGYVPTQPPRLFTSSSIGGLGPVTASSGQWLRRRTLARANEAASGTYSTGRSTEIPDALDAQRQAALDRNLQRTALRREQDAAAGPLGAGERRYRRKVTAAQRAIELDDISGLNNATQDALYRGFRPVQPGNGIQSEIWQEASSSRSGSTKRAEALRSQLRAERFKADPTLFSGAAQATSLLEDQLASGVYTEPALERKAQRAAASARSQFGLTNQDVQFGRFQRYQQVAEAAAAGGAPPPPPPPGYNAWAEAGAPTPGSGSGGSGGRGAGGAGANPYGGDRGGGWFSRLRQSVRGDSGLGGFFGQGALSVVRYGLPSMALYGAASGISNSLREAEEFQYNLARMESQLEALGESGTTNIDAVKDSILSLARNTGVAADQITEMQLRIRGAFEGENIGGLQGEALVTAQTDAAAKLAVVTKLDPTAVNNDLTAASLGFDKTFEQIGDIATGLEARSGVPSGELINFLGDVAPVAADAGFSAEQIASIGTLVLQRSGRSGTALAESFNRILPAVNQNKPQLLELAGQEESLRTPEFLDAVRSGDVATVITNLAENYEGLNKQSKDFVINLLGGRREAQALIPALSNSSRLTEFMKEASDSAGSLDERFAKLRETLTNTLARLGEQVRSITTLLLEAGLSDVFEVALTSVGLLVGGFTALLGPIAGFNEALGGVPGKLLAILALMKLMQVATGRFGGGGIVSGLFGGVGPRGGQGFSGGVGGTTPFVVGSTGVVTGGPSRGFRSDLTRAGTAVSQGVATFAQRERASAVRGWNLFQPPPAPVPPAPPAAGMRFYDPAYGLPAGPRPPGAPTPAGPPARFRDNIRGNARLGLDAMRTRIGRAGQGGGVISQSTPLVGALATGVRGVGGLAAASFASAGTFLMANPFVGIMALAAVYSLVSSQIDKAKQELDDLASEIREGNEKAYNLESSGKDATAVVRRYGALGEQAMAAFEDQGPWDRGWRTIFGVESEGELISGEREAMLLRPEERELLNAVAGTDLEDRGVRLAFGKTDRRASGQQTIAEFRRGQEDLASYGKDFKVSASGWKGALNDIGSFVPGLEDVGVYYGPDAVSVESLASSKESGALSTEGFELGKSIIEASGSTELNSDVFKAATGANRIDALTKIVDDADQKYSSDAQNQAKNILQKLREGGITDEEFAGAAFELEEAADPEAALTKNLQTLASLQESGYLSIEEYAKRGREALAGRAKALFGGNKQAATEEEIAAYLKDQAAFNASIGAARQKEVQQTLENYQAFGVDDTELSLRTIDLNLQTIRDPAIQDPDTIRNAALAVIQASNAVYGELASRAGSAEAAAAILDKAKDDPVVKEAVDALNKAKIMGSSTYKNGALGYQNLRRDSGTDLLDREIGPDAAFGMAYEDYMDDGAISEDTATFFQDQAAQINEEYKAAAESGKPIDGQQLDNMRGSMQFLMSIMKLFGIVAGEYDPTLVEGLDGTLPGFELTPAQLDKAREKEAFTRSQQRTTLEGQRNAAFASLGGDDTAAAKAVYDAAAANLAAFTDAEKYNDDGTETDEFIQAQITFAQTKKAWLDAQTSGAQAFVNLAVSEANLRRDSVGAAIAQLQGANDRLAKAAPGSPEAAQAQADQNAAIVALQNAQTQRALSRYDLLAAKAPQGTFTQATIARARAQEQVGRSVGDDLINAEIELTNAERAVRQAQEQRVQSLFRLAQAQNSGDSLASANFGVEAALKAVEFARNEFGADSSEYFDALAGLEQAEKSQRDAYANRVQALFALKKARQGDDPVAGAQLDLSAAQQLYADAVRAGDLDAQIQAEQQLIEAQKAYREAINQARYSQFNLRQAELQAMDDDVGAAQVAAELARQQLADAIARGAGAAEVNNLRAGVINAESNARDVLFRDKLDEYQYLLDTDKITKAQYINYLTALQNTLSPASDEFKELEVTLKRLKEGISGDLQANLPTSLALPTLYEVRRLNQSDPGTLGSSGIGYQDNRVVSITINDVTPDVKDQVVDVLYEALGTGRNGYGTRRY